MSIEESGRKRLQDLSKSLNEKITQTGDAQLTRRALKTIERLARDLTGESAMPGLRLWRDAAGKFRLQRPPAMPRSWSNGSATSARW
jgi:hypothetical protein